MADETTIWNDLDYKTPGDEEQRYINFLKKTVIGQDRAIRKLVAKLLAYKHGLNDKNEPACIVLFPGPSGVGKTSLARAFTDLLVGDPNAMSRIDCGNLQHDHADASLIGSPPGYVGYKEEPVFAQNRIDQPYRDRHPYIPTREEEKKLDKMNSDLLELGIDMEEIRAKVAAETDEAKKKILEAELRFAMLAYARKNKEIEEYIKSTKEKHTSKPCPSVVLLDEVEKAHHQIMRLLLSIFDIAETRLLSGEKTDFRNTFFFMTSNIGSEKLSNLLSGKKAPIGIVSQSKIKEEEKDLDTRIYDVVMEEIKKSPNFPAELLGRGGKENIIVFRPLSTENIKTIIDMQLAEMQKRVIEYSFGTTIICSQSLKDFILEETQNPDDKAYGARPVRNIIKAKIMEPLTNLIVKSKKGGFVPGDIIRLDVEEVVDEKGKKKKKVFVRKVDKNSVDVIGE